MLPRSPRKDGYFCAELFKVAPLQLRTNTRLADYHAANMQLITPTEAS
jgi:hypothetical protein